MLTPNFCAKICIDKEKENFMKIVFIGDSVTDCGRDRSDEKSLGNGYVKILSDKLLPLYPDEGIELINKGRSGDEVSDVLARVDEDVIAYNPDAVVMMIGINDVLHHFRDGKTLDLKKFADDFEELMLRFQDANIPVILLEPFLLPAPDKRRMRALFNQELAIISEIGMRYATDFVFLDEMFNGVAQSIPYVEFSTDGIHPTHRASRLIADNAIKVLRKHLL